MRRHSDSLRGANATTKTRFTGRKQNKRSEFCCLPVVLRKGANGGKREGERSERESVVPRHKNHEYFITCVNIPWTTYLSSGFDATFVQVESVMMRLFASNFTFLPICDFAYMVLRNSR